MLPRLYLRGTRHKPKSTGSAAGFVVINYKLRYPWHVNPEFCGNLLQFHSADFLEQLFALPDVFLQVVDALHLHALGF